MKAIGWIALLIIGFAAMTVIALGGYSESWDRALMLALRTGDAHEPIGPKWVQTAFLDITALGSNTTIILATLAAAIFLFIRRSKSAALLVILSAATGTALNNLLKLIFDRPRPDLVAHAVEVQTTSFPSGHAMLSAIVYLTLGLLLARTQQSRAAQIYIVATAAVMTMLIGISRVYLGVHWPSDVLAGWIAGLAWALICWKIAKSLEERERSSSAP